MKRIFFVICFLSGMAGFAKAQNIDIDEPRSIESMMDRFTEINRAKQYVNGWRVQVLATPDRRRLEEALRSFRIRYPKVSSDWVHSNPYYKLRAGAFATRLEALRLLHILKEDYPGAYLVRDNQVKPEELVFNY